MNGFYQNQHGLSWEHGKSSRDCPCAAHHMRAIQLHESKSSILLLKSNLTRTQTSFWFPTAYPQRPADPRVSFCVDRGHSGAHEFAQSRRSSPPSSSPFLFSSISFSPYFPFRLAALPSYGSFLPFPSRPSSPLPALFSDPRSSRVPALRPMLMRCAALRRFRFRFVPSLLPESLIFRC